jgi:hypothetical protein
MFRKAKRRKEEEKNLVTNPRIKFENQQTKGLSL